MTHRNAALSVEGRRGLVVRCQTRPITRMCFEISTDVVAQIDALRRTRKRIAFERRRQGVIITRLYRGAAR